jgi:hypothetical protein
MMKWSDISADQFLGRGSSGVNQRLKMRGAKLNTSIGAGMAIRAGSSARDTVVLQDYRICALHRSSDARRVVRNVV